MYVPTCTDGSLTCDCLNGYTASIYHLTPHLCATMAIEGYVCQTVMTSSSIAIADPTALPGVLDDQVNTLLETKEVANSM